MNKVIKVLANNPLLALTLLLSYIVGLWCVVYQVWNSGHEFGELGAVIILVTISFATKANAKQFIEKLKAAKNKKH